MQTFLLANNTQITLNTLSNSRLDKWKEEQMIPPFAPQTNDCSDSSECGKKFTSLDLIKGAKELIFDIVDGYPKFYIIYHRIDYEKRELRYGHYLDIIYDERDNQEEIKKDIKHTLAIALIADVPVYPNTLDVAEELTIYHKDMLLNGFVALGESGKEMLLVLAKPYQKDLSTLTSFFYSDLTHLITPAEIGILRKSVKEEFAKLNQAQKVLTLVKIAIKELDEVLKSPTRNENEIQRCLTSNPILFGFDYVKVIPKHKLGDDFITDYALEKVSGSIDVVEIEASTHRLFNKKGNPSESLVHAEQQVLDWLEWIEANSFYAKSKLPGLVSPIGFVIIGRSHSLTQQERIKLNRRNKMFGNKLVILTFDDLLERTKAIHNVLRGN